ncbi:MAG: tRNA 2-thiouridine(34) synthase MnmA [Alphaproteobacteria bacterium]|nr:tRNA 2-thiouridine(34) synthase MnmA [Alphaproteobacteria bacterium]
MSGGVDSSVTAGLMAALGYQVIGVTLRLSDSTVPRRAGACCAGVDIYDAKNVAAQLGIPHYVIDYIDKFREEVMVPFADAYASGETPVPCISCNRSVKFTDLLKISQDLGASALATGHYARRLRVSGHSGHSGREVALLRAVDAARDQSWFLAFTTLAQLTEIRFPLGGIKDKSTVRHMAQIMGLSVTSKPDSQDICFVPDAGYREIVGKYRPDALRSGDIVTQAGEVLGQHNGIIDFTIGQRRGLGIAAASPLYVIAIDSVNARVVVGPREQLQVQKMALRDMNYLQEINNDGLETGVRWRSSQTPVAGFLYPNPDHCTARVTLAQTYEGAAAPGQAAVFYSDDRVMAAGYILRP